MTKDYPIDEKTLLPTKHTLFLLAVDCVENKIISIQPVATYTFNKKRRMWDVCESNKTSLELLIPKSVREKALTIACLPPEEIKKMIKRYNEETRQKIERAFGK